MHNLNGCTDTINNVFLILKYRYVYVQQIRNARRHVVWKPKRQFTTDIEGI